jgi:hypothetical protein
MANGCGNYFALGHSYSDGQECEAWLEQRFGIHYFSQSSPVFAFDVIGILISTNWLLLWFFGNSSSAKPRRAFFWIVAVVGVAIPLVAKEFLPT